MALTWDGGLLSLKEDRWLGALVNAQLHNPADIWIAGGFLRDTLLGKPIKDVDVFVNTSTNFPTFCLEGMSPSSDEVYSESEMCCFKVVGTRLNIIQLLNGVGVKEYIDKKFDLGLCQIGIPLVGQSQYTLYTTPAFEEDCKNKTLTVINGASPSEHISRVANKYHDHTLITGSTWVRELDVDISPVWSAL